MALPLLGGAFPSHAQTKLPRVGVLAPSVQNRLLDTERGRGFLEGLAESGWADGRNVAIDTRFSDGRAETPQANATELVRLKVDVLAALAVPEILAARAATATIPITGIDLVMPLIFSSRAVVGDMALRHRVPAISTFPEIAQAGALMAFGPSLAEMWQRCGAQAGRILKGEAVATMPIERPYRFTFSVNLRAAKAIGLKLPQSLMLRAEEVIQ